MELYALSHCPEQAQRWPEYDFSQVLIVEKVVPEGPYLLIRHMLPAADLNVHARKISYPSGIFHMKVHQPWRYPGRGSSGKEQGLPNPSTKEQIYDGGEHQYHGGCLYMVRPAEGTGSPYEPSS